MPQNFYIQSIDVKIFKNLSFTNTEIQFFVESRDMLMIIEEIVSAIQTGKGSLVGITCEKPLGRNFEEAKYT